MTGLDKLTTPHLRKIKREIDEKLFNLNNLKFEKTEVIENKIRDDLSKKSTDIQNEIESRKRKKSNGRK